MDKEERQILNTNNFEDCFKIIKKYWNSEQGTCEICRERKNKTITLELTTGGRFENEEFIKELANTYFWFLWWQESKRGGYYKFIYSEVIENE